MKLSVIIPTKDRPALLVQAVSSALAALDAQDEVLVVDDRSAAPVAETLSITDPRLHIVASLAPPGASGARNFGVTQAQGDRILFLDDDDLLLAGYPAWVREQTAAYGFSPTLRFSGAEAPAQMPRFDGGAGTPVDSVPAFRHRVAGLGCGFWIDRAIFQQVGPIAEDIRINEDTDFSIRLLRAGLTGLRAPAAGVMVRVHTVIEGQRGHLTHSEKAADRARYFGMIIARHKDWLEEHPEAAQYLLVRQLKFLARAGDGLATRSVLGSALARKQGLKLRLHYAVQLGLTSLRKGR